MLENRYLKVTLVPEFGGRILSIIYKPTGHEQLYRTEVGVPYGIGGDIFYYDWLMVYGGIFPTFPDPEHGRTWLKRWDFKVVKESAGEVTVSMSLKDDFEYSAAPKRFKGLDGHRSDLLCHAEGRSRRARCAHGAEKSARQGDHIRVLDVHDAGAGIGPEKSQNYRRRRNHRADRGLQHAPLVGQSGRRRQEPGSGKSRFEKLRYFRNWPTMGIAYAAPDMQGGNFWGVINHDNEEGIIRIADNTVTPGLKMWTWGFPSFTNETDARKDPSEQRPYIELWAGVSDQFFHSANFSALGEVSVPETYSPTVGMSNVTHANEYILINLSAEASGVNLQFFSVEPATPLRVTLKRGDTVLFDDAVTADPKNGNRVFAAIPAGGSGERVQLTIRTAEGKELIAAETRIK